MRSVSIRHVGGLLPATRAPMPTGNQVRELGTCGGFSGPSSALKPGHPEHERKAEARGDSDQGQPEVGGWKEARRGPSYSVRSTSCCLSVPRHSRPFLSHEGHCNRKHPCPQWPGEALLPSWAKGLLWNFGEDDDKNVSPHPDSLLSHEPRICLLLMRKQKIPDRSGALRPNS